MTDPPLLGPRTGRKVDLTGATALVTGANRGIGRALVERLAQSPLALVLAGLRDPDRFEPVSDKVRPVRMDLSSRETIDECTTALGDDLDRIDLLVNNAGRMTGGLLEEQDVEAVYAMFQVNLVAVAHLTARVLPGMIDRGRGKIVNNASMSGHAFFPGATTYAASKAGVVGLTTSLRRELKGTGVSAMHVVTPGVDTDMLDATEDVYGRYMDVSNWDKVAPAEWAAKVVDAIESDVTVLNPPGKTGWAVRAAKGPALLLDAASARMFSRHRRS